MASCLYIWIYLYVDLPINIFVESSLILFFLRKEKDRQNGRINFRKNTPESMLCEQLRRIDNVSWFDYRESKVLPDLRNSYIAKTFPKKPNMPKIPELAMNILWIYGRTILEKFLKISNILDFFHNILFFYSTSNQKKI